MNACERFLATLRFEEPDRVPYYDQCIREDTLERWHREGLPRGVSVGEFFDLDHWELFGPREDVSLNLYLIPEFEGELKTRADFERLKRSYIPTCPERYPRDWDDHVRRWRDRDHPLGITAWRGFFHSLAVGDWPSLLNILYMIRDDPELLAEMTESLADFTLAVIEKALSEVEFDYAILDEPIASYHAPIIAPASFHRFVIPAYRRIVNRLRAAGIEVIILDTHGSIKPLIPFCLEAGVNALWCGAARAVIHSAFPERARPHAPANPLIVDVRVDEVAVDFLLALPGYEENIVTRAVRYDLDGLEVWICSPEDLIIQKAVAGRAQDWQDIEGILAEQHRHLDQAYVEDWLQQFAKALDRPQMLSQYRSIQERIRAVLAAK